jgi:hypothetical protein
VIADRNKESDTNCKEHTLQIQGERGLEREKGALEETEAVLD